MRMSCNGCRVLRKGCSDACSIRPCLQWIADPQWQANATVFLAKFYGRAGLINLLNAGPRHLRPSIFRSLLYEACGRIANPVSGSVGLLSAGSWYLCQAAVDAVLRGDPVVPLSPDLAASPVNLCDIRHASSASVRDDPPASRPRTRKRPSAAGPLESLRGGGQSKSRESSVTHLGQDPPENESVLSVEAGTPEAGAGAGDDGGGDDRGDGELELELTLGLEPSSWALDTRPGKKRSETSPNRDLRPEGPHFEI